MEFDDPDNFNAIAMREMGFGNQEEKWVSGSYPGGLIAPRTCMPSRRQYFALKIY